MDTTGMSPNMMLIARIEAERRRAGAKGYGDQVNNKDYSHLKVEMVRRLPYIDEFADYTAQKLITKKCEKCHNEFSVPEKSKRRVCDECTRKRKRLDNARYNKKRRLRKKLEGKDEKNVPTNS